VTLVWQRRVTSWGRALREEHRIKSLTRAEKEELISTARTRRPGRSRKT
jgi:predicted GIY-YIG superfamily endonuclease